MANLFLQEYEKIRKIGSGSFGSVYKVRHAELGYVRALKVCNNFIEDKNDKTWQTFMRECRVLLNIGNGSHPNIVRIYQPRLLENRAVVEMDCIEGENLHEYIQHERFIPFDEFMRFAEQMLSAVAYCHVDIYRFLMNPAADHLELDPADGRKYLVSKEKERELIRKYGVVHNDLHSGNIIRRDYDGSYILLDFGLAIQNNSCVKSSSRNDGAIEYSAPEKLSQGNVTAASDVYALGILMYEMLAGQVPFPYLPSDEISVEAARNQVYMQQLNSKPLPIFEKRKRAFEQKYPGAKYVKDYPDWIERIIFKCLEKDPARRYGNAKEVFQDLSSHSWEKKDNGNMRRAYEDRIAALQSSIHRRDEKIGRLEEELSTAAVNPVNTPVPAQPATDVRPVQSAYRIPATRQVDHSPLTHRPEPEKKSGPGWLYLIAAFTVIAAIVAIFSLVFPDEFNALISGEEQKTVVDTIVLDDAPVVAPAPAVTPRFVEEAPPKQEEEPEPYYEEEVVMPEPEHIERPRVRPDTTVSVRPTVTEVSPDTLGHH